MKKTLRKLSLLALFTAMSAVNAWADNVAKIGTTEYATLKEAVTAADDGATIELIADDNSLSDGSELEISKSLTITGAVDVNGEPLYTISGKSDATGTNDIFITGSGTVTLSNLKIKYFGNNASKTDPSHAPVYVSTYFTGTVNLTNVYISNFNRGGVFLYGGTFNVDNCYIDCANSTSGAFTKGIEIKGTANGTIQNTLICNMERSSTAYANAAIEIYGNGSVIVDGCMIVSDNDNHASVKATYGIVSSRVGVHDPSGGSLQVTNTSISCTNACVSVSDDDQYGPVNNYSITLDDCDFDNYIATWSATSSVTINSGSYAEDVYADAGTITINGGEFANFAPSTDTGTITINGGTFDNNSFIDYLSDGVVVDVDSEGNFVVSEVTAENPAIASVTIGGTTSNYATLAAAIAAVPTDGTAATITMLADETVAAGSTLTIATGKNIVLDLKGKTVTGSSTATGNVYFITNQGTLEITDNTQAADGKITFQSSKTDFSNERVTIYNFKGTLTLTNGLVENTTAGGMAYAINNSSNAWGENVVSTFNMTGGRISAPQGDAALRVYQNCAANNWLSHNYVNIFGGTIDETGIFVDQVLYKENIPANYNGSNIDTQINISGGTVNGLIDMKIRHPFNTSLNITGGDFSNTQIWVRKNAAEYVGEEPTEPMVTISDGDFDFKASNSFGLAYGYSATTWTSYSKPYEISGGTYDLPVPAEFCANGFESVEENGKYIVHQAESITLQDGVNYTFTTDMNYNTAIYQRSFDSDRLNRFQGWFVPFNYTIQSNDLSYFKFYRISMIAHSATPNIEANDDSEKIWIHLVKLNAGDELTANVPYIYKPIDVSTDYQFTANNVTLKAKKNDRVAYTATMDEEYSFYGVYEPISTSPQDQFYYMNYYGEISWGTGSPSVTVNPLRWIIRVTNKNEGDTSTQEFTPTARVISFVVDGQEETAIRTVETEGGEESYYTLDGMKVQQPAKGVYLKKMADGQLKKIFVK